MSMCRCITTKLVKIRKARTCFGCYASQPVGSEMSAQTNAGDSRIYTLHLCAKCVEAAKAMPYGGAFYEGEFQE